MDSDLHECLLGHKKRILSQSEVKSFASQLLGGVAHCHANDVLHLDLKPENVLINKQALLKLTDFGLSSKTGVDDLRPKHVITRWYRPPELFLGDRQYTTSLDMWSVGCIIAEMLLGERLFPAMSEEKQLEYIFHRMGRQSSELPQHHTELCQAGSGDRLWEELEGRGFPLLAIDLLQKLICLDPTQRISAEEALQHPFLTGAEHPVSFAVETPPKEEALHKRPRSDDGCESAQATNGSQPPAAKRSRIAADSEPCSSTPHDSGSQETLREPSVEPPTGAPFVIDLTAESPPPLPPPAQLPPQLPAVPPPQPPAGPPPPRPPRLRHPRPAAATCRCNFAAVPHYPPVPYWTPLYGSAIHMAWPPTAAYAPLLHYHIPPPVPMMYPQPYDYGWQPTQPTQH
ncbi:hypothetical protein WJX75_003786 [Coccomyxa subellipsoidea]|uniref:Protein kinase domain-containing protein n=1 Tax=Coccomyxa subellipsoidea TaxID=248742 RepID=A0ABR2Z3V5_9CHLO